MVSLKYYLVDKNFLRTWVNNKVIVSVQCMCLCVIKKINFNKIVLLITLCLIHEGGRTTDRHGLTHFI